MPTSLSNSLAIQSVRVPLCRGFSERPEAFYLRLNLRDWLNTLDWLFAEASDRLDELERGDASLEEIERERDILRMLEDEMAYLLRMFEGEKEVNVITVEKIPAVRRADDIAENYPKIGQVIDGWEVIEYISYTDTEARVRVQRPAM